MESSIQESGEGSGPDESIKQSIESEIKIFGKEIALFKSVSSGSARGDRKWQRARWCTRLNQALARTFIEIPWQTLRWWVILAA